MEECRCPYYEKDEFGDAICHNSGDEDGNFECPKEFVNECDVGERTDYDEYDDESDYEEYDDEPYYDDIEIAEGQSTGSAKHLCICATVTDEYHGYECEITGGACMYLRPNQDACAEAYGEVEHTDKWNKEHGIADQA